LEKYDALEKDFPIFLRLLTPALSSFGEEREETNGRKAYDALAGLIIILAFVPGLHPGL